MNKVILIGRLTKDPELRYTQSGSAVCNCTLAVSRPFTSQSGEQEADFINIIVWNKAAENLAKYMAKGRQLAVEGRLQIRNYEDKEGVKRWSTEVIANNVEFLGTKEEKKAESNVDDLSIGEEVVFSDDDLPW